MPSGGARVGAGRPRGSKTRPKVTTQKAAPKVKLKGSAKSKLEPLAYMLAVMNDPEVDAYRRDRMAMAAAPYLHAKPSEATKGKREQTKDRAREVGGKYAVPAGPKLVVSNG